MSYLLSNPFVLVAIFLGFAWAWLSFKDFFSWFKLGKLNKERNELEKKIQEIPQKVENMSSDEFVDFWNKK